MSVQNLNSVLSASQDYKGKKFKGVVVDNKDPLDQGRVKVRVPGLYDDGDLPWVGIVRSSPFGHGPGFGVYGAPAIGSVIELELQEGSANHAISHGYLADLSTHNSEYTGTEVWGYTDPAGNKLRVDMEAGTFHFTHQSGSEYIFDNGGNLLVRGDGTATIRFPNIVLDGDVLVTGTLTVEKLTSLLASLVLEGEGTHTGGSFISNGVTIHLHIHEGVHGLTTPPIGGT